MSTMPAPFLSRLREGLPQREFRPGRGIIVPAELVTVIGIPEIVAKLFCASLIDL